MAAVRRWGVGGWERARCAACAATGAHPGPRASVPRPCAAALFTVPNSKASARCALPFDSAAAKSRLRQMSTTHRIRMHAYLGTDGAARRSAHLGFLDIEQIQCSYPELTCVFWVGSISGLRPFRFDVRARRRSGACAWRLRPPAAALGGKHCGAIFFFGFLGVGCCPPFLERVLRARRGRKKIEHA